jgi:hypothetical protein
LILPDSVSVSGWFSHSTQNEIAGSAVASQQPPSVGFADASAAGRNVLYAAIVCAMGTRGAVENADAAPGLLILSDSDLVAGLLLRCAQDHAVAIIGFADADATTARNASCAGLIYVAVNPRTADAFVEKPRKDSSQNTACLKPAFTRASSP